MFRFTAVELATWTGGVWTREPRGGVTGFHFDTRKLELGSAFVALTIGQRDGHAFLAAAESAGAEAAIVSRPVPGSTLPQLVVADTLAAFQAIAAAHRQRFPGAVVGVTGSAGKTSTKNLLATLLGGAETVLATEGNLNNHLGVPLTLTRINPGVHRFAVIEAGISAPGEMGVLADMIRPDVAVVTLVGPAHLAELGGLAGVAAEKSVLASRRQSGCVAIFPAACLAYAEFATLSGAVTVGADAPATVRMMVSAEGEQSVLRLVGGEGAETYRLTRVSAGMASNAALAITTARWLGVSAATVQERLLTWQPGAMRAELRRDGDRWLYLDCYNANPASMHDALAAFVERAPASEPRLYILGGMEELGAGARDYHRELGRALRLREGDHALVIGGEASAVREGALAAGNAAARIEVIETLRPARERMQGFKGAVFIKGSRRYALEGVLSEGAAPAAH